MISQIFRLDSPLLCQAVVLTELIRFVRRCSTSWPKSMTDFGMTSHKSDEGGFSKDVFSRLSLSAGRNFYIWAESLAAELEELSRSDLQARMYMIRIIFLPKIFDFLFSFTLKIGLKRLSPLIRFRRFYMMMNIWSQKFLPLLDRFVCSEFFYSMN